MDAKKKKIIFVLGAIFVAVIFLSSYAAFSNNGTAATTTSTIKSESTFYAFGSSTAIVTNYSDIANVTLINSTNSSKGQVSNAISELEANGTVQNYIYTDNSYQVVLSSISPYQLQQFIYNKTNMTNTISVGSTAFVMLPGNVTLYYTNQPIRVSLANRNYSLYISKAVAINTTVNVSISGLLARNGSIYDGQFRVAYAKFNNQTTITSNAFGHVNAIITNYTDIAYVTPLNSSNSLNGSISNAIANLEANGVVQNYTYTNNSYQVSLLHISPYDLKTILYNNTAFDNSVTVGAAASITFLQSNVILASRNASVTLHSQSKNYTIFIKNVKSVGSIVNVTIAAQLMQNGSIYKNQLKITES